jgi:hypothetical protein
MSIFGRHWFEDEDDGDQLHAKALPIGLGRAMVIDAVGNCGPVIEQMQNGRWALPNPPVVMNTDIARIRGRMMSRVPLDLIDAELVRRILEINSERA